MFKRIIVVYSLAFACLGADPTNTLLRTSPQSMDLSDNKHRLGPGDRITYRVIEDQDPPVSLTIADSGDLQVPYLGLVPAAGKTSMQLATDVKTSLEKNLYYQATVIIAVETVNKSHVIGKFYVAGYVRNTGGYDVLAGEPLTVTKAILKAGGFSDFSDKKNVRLIRNIGTAKKTITVNVQEILEKGTLENDLEVQAGDMVVVPGRLVNF